MTDKTSYYQAKNRQALKHGGLFRCPACIGVVDHLGDGYRCTPCDYTWSADGEPKDVKP